MYLRGTSMRHAGVKVHYENLLSYVRLVMNRCTQRADADDAVVATQPVRTPGTVVPSTRPSTLEK